MSLPSNSQPLIAAFTFGITFQAGAGAFLLCVQGQGKKLLRDGLRLALTAFIASAALWSQIAFSATLVDPSSSAGCQAAVAIASLFDQLGRVALEQYLLWAINSGLKKSPDTFVPQGILVIRLVVGVVFVGLQRPQLQPVCQTSSGVFAIGIAVAVADFVMALIFLARAPKVGLLQDIREKRPGLRRSKAILLLIAGLALWTGTSVPMFLGIRSIDLIWRTALPAATLSLLLGLVAVFMGDLIMSRERASMEPQDPSLRRPFDTSRDLQSRDISTAESSYPPSRFEDLKADEVSITMSYSTGQQAVAIQQTMANSTVAASLGYAAVPGAATAGIVAGRPLIDRRAFPGPQHPQAGDSAKFLPKAKGGIFSRGGGPAAGIAIGKLAISNPILQRKTEEGPLNKIATIDLATAAKMDRERRDMANINDSQSLIAQRAAPLPPAMTPDEVLRREQSLKRKQVARRSSELLGPPPPLVLEQPLVTTGTAAVNTSLQPSPSTETVRRRSPRSSPRQMPPQSPSRPTTTASRDEALAQRERVASTRTTVTQSSAATAKSVENAMEPVRPALPPTWPKQKSVRNTIRPSRTQTSRSPESAQDAAAPRLSPDTTLQRRGTVGLPSNPRSRAVMTPGQEITGRQPTVMFMKGIQYHDPVAVQNIMQGASAKTPQPLAKSAGIKPRESIVNRPRPIPRQVEKDRQIFPAEQSPVGHKRTRSGGSVVSRLRDQPGSPSNLPPLPPAPKSAGYPSRPLPNDTRSMTFDEKMDLFFPRPKSSGALRETVSIPAIPALPPAYAMERNQPVTTSSRPSDAPRSSSRASGSSTKTSIRTQSILEIAQSPMRPPMPNTSKFSIDTYMTADRQASDEVKGSWLPGLIPYTRVRSGQSLEGAKRRSSPVLPMHDGTMSEFSDVRTRTDEEIATNWGSVHSPVIMEARQVQVPVPAINPKYIKKDSSEKLDLPETRIGGVEEIMTIMLDPATEYETKATASVATEVQHRWHHRIGDQCATFSARKDQITSRRMPPPPPLLLNLSGKKQIIIAGEPSPLESPQDALRAIQDQLRKFEEPAADSSDDQEQRLRLLEDLEQEMGQQEDQWHEMQIGIHRDSLSTMDTTSRRVSRQDAASPIWSSQTQSQRTSFAAHREACRASRLQIPNRNPDTASTRGATSPAGERNSIWPRNLAEVDVDSPGVASDFLSLRSSFKLVSVTMTQLGSPTPPETDSDNEEILRAREVLQRSNAPVAKLWVPAQSVSVASKDALWMAPPRPKPVAPEDIPGILLRPAARKISEPLAIESSRMWSVREAFAPRSYTSTIGLWRGASIPEMPKPRPRPVTQRPPRRNKRVSNLADIVENPEPLPNKRGTLGIFQFPWGEKSDNATVQVRPSNTFMAMPGTMSTGGFSVGAALESRSMQLMSQEESFSESFFEDYDEEEDDDEAYISEINEEDSDGEFDETTLWEIASLLRSNQVPSKYSLLPQPLEQDRHEQSFLGESVFEASNYEFGDAPASDVIRVRDEDACLEIGRQESDSLVFEASWPEIEALSVLPVIKSLWEAPVKDDTRESTGLFNLADKRSDFRYSTAPPAALYMARKQRSSDEPVEPVTSSSMWKPQAGIMCHIDSGLWRARTYPEEESSIAVFVPEQPLPKITASLWSLKHEPIFKTKRFDLFSPGQLREQIPAALPAALETIRRPRANTEPLPRLTTDELWSTLKTPSVARNWILSAYKTPADSPDAASTTPSGSNSTLNSEPASAMTAYTPHSSAAVPSIQVPTDTLLPGPSDSRVWWELDGAAEPPRAKPLRWSFEIDHSRPPITSNADWDAALQDAIVAGVQEHRKALPGVRDQALWNAVSDEQQIPPKDRPTSKEVILLLDRVYEPPAPTKASPAALWTQSHPIHASTGASLWAPVMIPTAPSSFLMSAEDPVAQQLRLNKVKGAIPQFKKAGIRTQADVDCSIVSLVNFRGQSLWCPHKKETWNHSPPRGGDRNWISSGQAAPVRASQAVFTFWLPRSGEVQ